MNAYSPAEQAEPRFRLARIVRVCARILGALALLPLLTACLTPVAAEQITIKAVARPRPLSATALPAATATPAPIATPAPTATSAPAVPAASIGTNGGEWEFDVSELEIAAGQDVALTFNNGARSTLHNWLLIDGDEYAAIEINQAGEQAGEQAGYIPDDARIIAHTFGLVKGGHSQTVTFTAPPAGTYIYLCTFPGHFEVGMRGVLTVR